MHRLRFTTCAALAASLTVLAGMACSAAPEKPILNQFFTASRLRDNTSLQSFAIVALSFSDQRNPVDYRKYDGELLSKDVAISATVREPNGQSTQKPLVVTMRRAVLKATPEIAGRWIITNVKESGVPAGTKSS